MPIFQSPAIKQMGKLPKGILMTGASSGTDDGTRLRSFSLAPPETQSLPKPTYPSCRGDFFSCPYWWILGKICTQTVYSRLIAASSVRLRPLHVCLILSPCPCSMIYHPLTLMLNLQGLDCTCLNSYLPCVANRCNLLHVLFVPVMHPPPPSPLV